MYFSSMTQIVRFWVYLPETLVIFLEDTRHKEWQQRPYNQVLSFRWILLTVNWLPKFPLPILPWIKLTVRIIMNHVLEQWLLPKNEALIKQDGGIATIHEKLVTFCVHESRPSLNLKTSLPIARSWIQWTTPFRVLYNSCLSIMDSRRGAAEGRYGSVLGTDQPEFYWTRDQTVLEVISFDHWGEGRSHWTWYKYCRHVITAFYMYVIHMVKNENELIHVILCHPVCKKQTIKVIWL